MDLCLPSFTIYFCMEKKVQKKQCKVLLICLPWQRYLSSFQDHESLTSMHKGNLSSKQGVKGQMNKQGCRWDKVSANLICLDIHFRLPSIYAFYLYIYRRVEETSISFISCIFSPSIYAFYYLPNIQTSIYSSSQTTEGMNCFLIYTFRAEREYLI